MKKVMKVTGRNTGNGCRKSRRSPSVTTLQENETLLSYVKDVNAAGGVDKRDREKKDSIEMWAVILC